jgi:hypothetical protein
MNDDAKDSNQVVTVALAVGAVLAVLFFVEQHDR